MIPGSAVRHASEARHITDCATLPGLENLKKYVLYCDFMIIMDLIGNSF